MRNDTKKIGIIGAGVGGLIAAKTFLEEGFDCEVLERKGSLGGVWESGYHSLHLQLPKESYEFLDWPMPASFPTFPSCDQIVSYLNAYARHFRVFKKIHFHSRVDKLEKRPGDHGWIARCHDTKRGEDFERSFDFVIVCNGLYSTPQIPRFPNQDRFKGRIVHSSQFQDPEILQDTNVVVVGFGKSALDRAEEFAPIAKRVTLVFRQAHWPVPRKFLGVLDSKYMISRFMSAFMPRYLHPGKWEKRLHDYGGGLIWAYWRFMEWILRAQFRLKSAGALPSSRLERDIFTGDFVASPNIYRLIHEDEIHAEQSSIDHFTENGVQLSNGKHVDADTVVLGTGWAYDHSFLPDTFEAVRETDGLYLYRHILHPDFPRLAFVGLASTFSNSLSDHLEVRWLVALLKGEISLPDRAHMLQEIEQMKAWKRDIMPEQNSRGSLLQVHALHYHDELLRDLDIECKRKGNFVAELFGAYLPADYRDIPSVYLRKKASPSRTETAEESYPESAAAADTVTNGGGLGSSDIAAASGIDLQMEDLTAVDLRGLHLDGMDLSDRILSAADLRHASLHGCNLTGVDFAAADISGADLTSAELFNSDFTGAIMSRVDLERAFLMDANLSLAYLNGANLTGAHLSGANLTSARLNNARLVGADLSNTRLNDADLRGANLENCDLSNADLTGADLTGANLKGATLLSADFTDANITGVQFDATETCRDIRISTAHGNALFKRYAQDQAYVEEYKFNNPLRYALWKYSSNCGRSLSLWVFWCVFIAVSFSLVFHFHLGGTESFMLTELAKEPGYDPEDWAPMLYYSVVTFTTLGFGDIVPRTQEAAWWIMAEVVMGYFMLGGLITILATKLARRS
ncbi:MAG: pentapeptide repeat-containing protein [Gammaproteobacteria bacterium]|nr:pentapeptide repeat-containing protein [Gammaproteobacteria bacterium]